MSKPSHILSVLTPDNKGIIHTIVDTMKSLDVMHHEISQTVVHDTFTIALVVSIPATRDVGELKHALETAIGESAQVSVLTCLDTDPAVQASSISSDNDRYILTATGKSISGSVHALTQVISQRGGNFTDFSSRVVGDQINLVAEVDLPAEVALDQLQSDLRHASADQTLQVRLQHQKLFTATNEVAFRRKFDA